MTEKEFLKKRFQPFELMEYHDEMIENIDGGKGAIIDCVLLAVDFETKRFKLVPIPEGYYEEEEFWTHCKRVKRPAPKMKIVK